ncbi:MAG: hypothetical protein ACLP3C_11070 [Mycobacterium sp.]|uniref:hypothetical protein n=1 Tax=Mycobacterium sp. TaxID=1785 RepID=UPI003F991243
MDLKPLGDYEMFRRWSEYPSSPVQNGRVWCGGNVIKGLCDVLDEHTARYGNRSAAIGCVPWLDDDAVADRLIKLGSCCVVIDKPSSIKPAVVRLKRRGTPIFNRVFSKLVMTTPDAPRWLGPSSNLPEHELGPVRVAGFAKKHPLLHAKVLVLGNVADCGCPEFFYEDWHFTAQAVWCGSANWTKGSRSNLEVAQLSDEPGLVRTMESFVEDVIRFSEPIEMHQVFDPEPNLAVCEFDDDAMAEACAAIAAEEEMAAPDDDPEGPYDDPEGW